MMVRYMKSFYKIEFLELSYFSKNRRHLLTQDTTLETIVTNIVYMTSLLYGMMYIIRPNLDFTININRIYNTMGEQFVLSMFSNKLMPLMQFLLGILLFVLVCITPTMFNKVKSAMFFIFRNMSMAIGNFILVLIWSYYSTLSLLDVYSTNLNGYTIIMVSLSIIHMIYGLVISEELIQFYKEYRSLLNKNVNIISEK